MQAAPASLSSTTVRLLSEFPIMKVAVIIVTNNRKLDLRRAIASALEQRSKPEVLVVDDGSTDGTSDMVRSEFPQVRLEQSTHSLGYIAQRNRAAHVDAVFSSPRVVEQAAAAFGHPRVAAVAIPYAEPHKGGQMLLTVLREALAQAWPLHCARRSDH